jgi:hypothetical protein
MIALDPRSVVLDVIRGTQRLGDLSGAGVLVHITDATMPADYTRQWSFQAPKDLVIAATSSDVAKGILNNLRDPTYTRDWAGFLIAAPFIQFEFDEERDGLSLVDLLSDLSMGSMPSEPEIGQIRVLATS